MAALNDPRMITTPETIEMLRERAAKEGDTFVVKVQRRKHPGLPPELVASLSGVLVEHIVNYELWVPQLCGGGKLLLSVFHTNDVTKQVGGFVNFEISAAPKDADLEALKRPDWRGPSTIDYPLPPERRPQDVPDMYTVRPPSPPGPGTGDSATAVHSAWARSPGGGFTRQEYGDNVVGFDRVSAKMGQVENERRRVEEERLVNERERHKAELDAVKREQAAEMRALELKMMTQFSANSKPSGPDPMMTMLMEQMKQQAEDRRAAENRAAAAALEAEKQRAEDRRAAEARQAAADARFEKLIEKMSEKKPEKDPLETFKSVAELMKKNDDGSTKAIHSMMETMGTINNITMDFVDRMAEMQLGGKEPESPIVKGAEAVAKAITGMIKGNAMRKQVPPQYAPQQLPPQAPRQQAPQPPQDMSVLGQIEKGIRLKLDPKEIARVLIANINDPGVLQAAMESGNDFEVAFDKRLGNWKNESPANMAYFQTLITEIEKAAIAAGIMAPEQPEDAQVEDPDEAPEGEGDEAPEGDDEAP